MAEEHPEVTFKGSALYDPVRFQYFKRFEDALNHYQVCIEALASGHVPTTTYAFISKVCALYVEVVPKLNYQGAAKLNENVQTIEKHMRLGEFKPKQQLKENQFINPKIEKQNERQLVAIFLEYTDYLFQLREFMELNGITKYENPKYDPAEEVIRARAGI